MNGLIDRLRRLLGFGSLDRIKKAIEGLSEEEFHELEMWMASQSDEDEEEGEYENVKCDPSGKTHYVPKGQKTWY